MFVCRKHTSVSCICVQATKIMSNGTQQLRGHSHCTQFDISVGLGACTRMSLHPHKCHVELHGTPVHLMQGNITLTHVCT